VNPDTTYKWITRKKLPAHKVRRLWKFVASEADPWVKGGHAAEDVAGGQCSAAAPHPTLDKGKDTSSSKT